MAVCCKPNSDAASSDAKDGAETPDVTGSFVTQPAEPGPSGEPVAPLWKLGLVGDDPNDDLPLAGNISAATISAWPRRANRAADEKHPNDAEAWVGLAASYDRLHRFDLSDRAYAQAIRVASVRRRRSPFNDQGFSYMLRGDYARAHKKLEEAQAKDPANPYVHSDLQLLEESYHDGKAIQ